MLHTASGAPQGGLNSRLHAVCDGQGRPVRLLLTAGQMNDLHRTAMLLPALPNARKLIGDRGYGSSFRADLLVRGIQQCIPSTRSRKVVLPHDGALCRQDHRIENVFGRLEDWRRVVGEGNDVCQLVLHALGIGHGTNGDRRISTTPCRASTAV